MTRTRTRSSSRSLLATGLAGTALLLAVTGGGAAVAAGLARDSVASRHVQDGTLRGVDVADDSLTGKDVAEGSLDTVETARWADTADRALSAGDAETARRLIGMTHIMVSAEGVVRTVDETKGRARQVSPGHYEVTLNAFNLGCPVFATVSHNRADPVAGSAATWRKGPLQETLGRVVVVETHAPDGDDVPDPLPFTLMVVC